MRLRIANPGEKNIPIHTMPWLFTKCKIFSAILKSPYWNEINLKFASLSLIHGTLGKRFSKSQHQHEFM